MSMLQITLPILGAAMITAAGGLIGALMSSRLETRVRSIERLQSLLAAIRARLSLSRMTVPAMLKSFATDDKYIDFTFIKACSEAVAGDIPLSRAWRESLERFRGCELRPEDLAPLLPIGDFLGAATLEVQLGNIEQCEALLDEQRRMAADDSQRHGKLYRTLGLFAGAFLAIVLL